MSLSDPHLCEPLLAGMVPGSGLLFGLMLIAAIGGGYAARFVHIPRVVGFLVGGLGLRLVLQWTLGITEGSLDDEALQAAALPLEAIKDLALGLILFSIGHVFERKHLRTVGAKVLRISVTEIAFVIAGIFLACFLVGTLTAGDVAVGDQAVFALLLALAGIATAPAATLFVLREFDAKGRITDTILTLTGINNLVCIVLFYGAFLLMVWLGVISTTGLLEGNVWVALLETTLGSVVLGLLCGGLISVAHGKLPLAESLLIFFALFIVLGAGEKWLLQHAGVSFNFLLTSLVIGAVFVNVAIDAQKLETSLRTVGSPIFAAFFVMAGYNLHLDNLLNLGWIGGAYVVGRLAGKMLGARLGLRWAGMTFPAGCHLGSSLFCQAAVVIGLADFVARSWDHPLAGQFATVILGSVVVFELIGPVLIKRCVVQGGEVKAVSLLRREGPLAGSTSLLRLTVESVLRVLGIRSVPRVGETEDICVKHIMRTNVHFLHARDRLNDVLHFVERSKHDSFIVVDEQRNFVGTIRFRDMRDMVYEPALLDLLTAVDLADPDAAIVHTDMTLDDLLDIFRSENLGLIPVTDQPGSRKIVGVVEERDLLAALHRSGT